MSEPARAANAPDSVPCANSVFEQPWWLEAVAPGQWGAVTVTRGAEVVARLPYGIKRRFGVRILGNPPLTPMLGPWLAPLDGKPSRRMATRNTLVADVVGRLPRFDLFNQTLSPAFASSLPLQLAGFAATTRYTYRLDDLRDPEAVWSGFRQGLRHTIKAAKGRLEVRSDLSLGVFLDLLAATFQRTGVRYPYDDTLIRGVDRACADRDARVLLFAVDEHGRAHAAVYLVQDDSTVYYLMSGRSGDREGEGATSLLLWEALKLAGLKGQAFDFEGGMIPSIEEFFRGFGGTATPYFRVWKARPVVAAFLSLCGAAEVMRGRSSVHAESLAARMLD